MPKEAECFCDERGNVVIARLDDNHDGIPDRETKVTYDARNRRTGLTMDVGVDGSIDVRATVSYDASGARVTRWDRDGDGRVDSVETHNAEDELMLVESDTDGDGILDDRCAHSPPCPPPYWGPQCGCQ